MAGLVPLTVWVAVTVATAGAGWALDGTVGSLATERSTDDEDGESTDEESDGAPVRSVDDRRRTALGGVAAGLVGFETWGRSAGGSVTAAAAVAGVVSGGLLAATLSRPDRSWLAAVPTSRPTLRSPDSPGELLRRPTLPTLSVPSFGGSSPTGDEEADDGAPLPVSPERVADDDAEDPDEDTEDTPLRPDVSGDEPRETPTPTVVSLDDGDPDHRPDGPVLFADGAGESEGEECCNCGQTPADVRSTRIATVPDRDAERLPLCDDCRVAAAAREDDPDTCATIARRVDHVGGDDGRCDNCGYLGRLSAHAVVPLDDAGRPHHRNAVALCETCHDAAHGRRETEPTP